MTNNPSNLPNVKLDLRPMDIETILQALASQPYGKVADTVHAILAQANAQIPKPNMAPVPAPDDDGIVEAA